MSHLTDPPVFAEYDSAADVLYVTVGKIGRPAWTDEDEIGLVWRFSEEDDLPIGVTIIDFREVWALRRKELVRRMAEKLRLSRRMTERTLAREWGNEQDQPAQ